MVMFGLLHGGAGEAREAKIAKAAASKAPASQISAEDLQKTFDAFCAEWMHKLAVREHDNIAHIVWDTGTHGVEGEYIGYKNDHTCVVKASGTAPVGEMTYVEVRYAKRGRTIEEARQSPAEPVEQTGVTELFGYAKNKHKWVY